jgi:hypothetical protein
MYLPVKKYISHIGREKDSTIPILSVTAAVTQVGTSLIKPDLSFP